VPSFSKRVASRVVGISGSDSHYETKPRIDELLRRIMNGFAAELAHTATRCFMGFSAERGWWLVTSGPIGCIPRKTSRTATTTAKSFGGSKFF